MTIRAHLSDWHTDNPNLHPLRWVAAFVCAILVYIAVMAVVGTMINGG